MGSTAIQNSSQKGKKYKFKTVLGGEAGVGKSSLVRRWINGVFLGIPRVTIGVDFHTHHLTFEGHEVTLVVWDLGGQKRFLEMGVFNKYVKGARGGFLAFDLTNKLTLNRLSKWLTLFKEVIDPENIVLIGTKADLVKDREVTQEQVEEFKRQNGLRTYIETSSLNGQNVQLAFTILVRNLINPTIKKSVTLLPRENTK